MINIKIFPNPIQKNGNWILLDKNLIYFLPSNRKFSEIEATFLVTFDHDNNSTITISGYAKRWGWSRNRVGKFLKSIGMKVIYSKNKRKGYLKITKVSIS